MPDRSIDDILKEITDLNGQDDKAAFEKFLEIAAIGRDTNNKYIHVMGTMNAAALAFQAGTSDICMKLMAVANEVDEEIWNKYMQEPHMQSLVQAMGRSGAFN